MASNVSTFQGSGSATGYALNWEIRDEIERRLLNAGYGVLSVTVNGGSLTSLVNFTIRMTTLCIHTDKTAIAALIRDWLSYDGFISNASVRFDRVDRSCTASEAVGGGFPSEGVGGGVQPGYIHNAGNIATVEVRADDGEESIFDRFIRWVEQNQTEAMIGVLMLVVLMRR